MQSITMHNMLTENNNNNNDRINQIMKLVKSDQWMNQKRNLYLKLANNTQKYFIQILDDDKLTLTNPIDHTIKIKPTTQPIYRRPYRLPFSQINEINEQITTMENDDILGTHPCQKQRKNLIIRASKNLEKHSVFKNLTK